MLKSLSRAGERPSGQGTGTTDPAFWPGQVPGARLSACVLLQPLSCLPASGNGQVTEWPLVPEQIKVLPLGNRCAPEPMWLKKPWLALD